MLASKMRGAVSYQKTATADSWKKWDGQGFTRRDRVPFHSPSLSRPALWLLTLLPNVQENLGVKNVELNGTISFPSNFYEDGERFRDINGDRLPNGEHPAISWNRFHSKHKNLMIKRIFKMCFNPHFRAHTQIIEKELKMSSHAI